ALFQQLGGAGLVGRRGGDDEDRTGALALAGIESLEQIPDGIVRFVAAGANPDVPRAAEQRDRARLVGQPDRVGTQFAAGQFDRLSGSGQQAKDGLRGRRGAGFVRPADEEPPPFARRARRALAEIALGGLHVSWRSVSASRATIRSATSFARFSSAV